MKFHYKQCLEKFAMVTCSFLLFFGIANTTEALSIGGSLHCSSGWVYLYDAGGRPYAMTCAAGAVCHVSGSHYDDTTGWIDRFGPNPIPILHYTTYSSCSVSPNPPLPSQYDSRICPSVSSACPAVNNVSVSTGTYIAGGGNTHSEARMSIAWESVQRNSPITLTMMCSKTEGGVTTPFSTSDTETVCPYPAASCQGGIPQNASRWDAEEAQGLAESRNWTHANPDSATKCEFRCNSGYAWNGSACILTPPALQLRFNTCSGEAVPNSFSLETGETRTLVACNESNQNVTDSTTWTEAFPGAGAITLVDTGASTRLLTTNAMGAEGVTIARGSLIDSTSVGVTPLPSLTLKYRDGTDTCTGAEVPDTLSNIPVGTQYQVVACDEYGVNISGSPLVVWNADDMPNDSLSLTSMGSYYQIQVHDQGSERVHASRNLVTDSIDVSSVAPDLKPTSFDPSGVRFVSGFAVTLTGAVSNESAVDVTGFANKLLYKYGALGTWFEVDTASHGSLDAASTVSDNLSFIPPVAGDDLYLQYCVDANMVNLYGEINEGTVGESNNCVEKGPYRVMSATLIISPCSILAGDSECWGSVQYTFDYADNPYSVINVMTSNTELVSSPADATGFNGSVRMLYGENVLEARTAGLLLKSETRTVECVPGTGWSTVTVPPSCRLSPDITIEANPKLIRNGETTTVIATVNSQNRVSCTVVGATNGVESFSHDGIVSPSTTKNITTKKIYYKQNVVLNCLDTDTGISATADIDINVLPTVQEI